MFHEIDAKDQRENNWVIREYDTGSQRQPYFRDACQTCQRVDLFGVLREFGIPSDQRVRVRKGTDMYHTSDGYTAMSQRMKEVIDQHGIQGLAFHAMPNDPFYIIEPTCEIDVDFSVGHFNFGDTCEQCDRQREIAGLLRRSDIRVDVPPNTVFSPKHLGRRPDYRLYASSEVIETLKQAKLNGLIYDSVPE